MIFTKKFEFFRPKQGQIVQIGGLREEGEPDGVTAVVLPNAFAVQHDRIQCPQETNVAADQMIQNLKISTSFEFFHGEFHKKRIP